MNGKVDIDLDRHTLSTGKLAFIMEELSHYEQEAKGRAVEIMKLDERTRLTEKGIEIILTAGLETIMPFLKENPFVESIIMVFRKSLSKISEIKIRPYLQRLAEKVVSGKPGEWETAIKSEARAFVKRESKVKEAWDEYVGENRDRLQEQRKELAQRTNSTKDASRELKERMRVKREELLAEKHRLLADLRTRFAQLAQNFLPPIARKEPPFTPYYGYYDYKDVNGYLKRAVESFERADVTVNQIEVLKQFAEETNFEETSPEKRFESVQRIIAQKLGLEPVEKRSQPIGPYPGEPWNLRSRLEGRPDLRNLWELRDLRRTRSLRR